MLDDNIRNSNKNQVNRKDFIQGNAGINEGQDFPLYFLIEIYERVARRSIIPNYRFESSPIFTKPLISGNLFRQSKKCWKEHIYTLSDNCLYF